MESINEIDKTNYTYRIMIPLVVYDGTTAAHRRTSRSGAPDWRPSAGGDPPPAVT